MKRKINKKVCSDKLSLRKQKRTRASESPFVPVLMGIDQTNIWFSQSPEMIKFLTVSIIGKPAPTLVSNKNGALNFRDNCFKLL